MLPEGTQRVLVVHPTSIYLLATFILAFFALQVSPSFFPLVLLLAILRLFVIVVISRRNAGFKLALITVCLALATTLTNIRTCIDAIPELRTSTAVVSLFLLTLLTSILIIAAILLDMSLRSSSRRQWSQFILFPTVWSTVLLIAASSSPLGYLAIWNPVVGVGGYSWTRPILGPTGIDWVVAAWAVVLSELMAAWIMASSDQDEDDSESSLISTSDEEINRPKKTNRNPWLLCTVVLLCIGTAPSYLQKKIPTPVNSESTVPLPVACALPYIGNKTRLPSFDEFLQESTTLTSLAKVVLWPEGAVFFDSDQMKNEAIEKVAKSAGGSVVGVSFVDHMDERQSDKLRNGFMLIDKDGVVLEYFKRHLVPFVESNSMVSYSSPPELFEYQLVTRRNSRGKAVEFLSVPMTASICMDFAHPMPFNKLPQRPSLILGPAHTWQSSIGLAMWEQAKARAEEVGSAVLWCDGGEEGISGVGGRGMGGGEAIQVGPGSWVRTIGLEREAAHKRTFYTLVGPWLSVIFTWLLFGTEKVSEIFLRKMNLDQHAPVGSTVNGMRKKIVDTYLAWRRGRQADVADEHTHLL
ncbi:hypothetical protein ACEPAI_445 [Sanghuangporus weigelae]